MAGRAGSLTWAGMPKPWFIISPFNRTRACRVKLKGSGNDHHKDISETQGIRKELTICIGQTGGTGSPGRVQTFPVLQGSLLTVHRVINPVRRFRLKGLDKLGLPAIAYRFALNWGSFFPARATPIRLLPGRSINGLMAMAWRSFTLYKITIMLDIGKTVEVDHFYFIIGGSLSHYQVDQFYIDKRIQEMGL